MAKACPICRNSKTPRTEAGFDEVRYFDYTPEKKRWSCQKITCWVGQATRCVGKSMVVQALAKGLYTMTGSRPRRQIRHRPRRTQQYEQQLVWTSRALPIKRLDIKFDLALRKLQEDATAKGLWKGTPAARDRADYWTAGVLGLFRRRRRRLRPQRCHSPHHHARSPQGVRPRVVQAG